MFFEGDRIDAMREMILADNVDDRKAALAKLLPYQRADFVGIFKALKGYPATIRFLDPPLHEFLPHEATSQADLGKKIGVSAEKIAQRVAQLHEFNPMLGHRGCRLGIAYPEITEMQARAIFEAAADVAKKRIKVKPEIMIPLVGFKKEFDLQAEIVHRVAKEVMSEKKVKIRISGRHHDRSSARRAHGGRNRKSAEFFSFGTNDLTQMALGISRDDMGNFLMPYVENDIFKKNPFATLDQTGVGQLMQIAVDKGRRSRAQHQARDLRRTRRRSGKREVLPSSRVRLRQLQSVPRPNRPPCGSPSSASRKVAELPACKPFRGFPGHRGFHCFPVF